MDLDSIWNEAALDLRRANPIGRRLASVIESAAAKPARSAEPDAATAAPAGAARPRMPRRPWDGSGRQDGRAPAPEGPAIRLGI